MSLVTLIKSADATLRDAVVQIEEWALPKEAILTDKLDEAGRRIFTLLKADVAEVEAAVKTDIAVVKTKLAKIKAEAKVVANTAENDVENLINDVEEEAKKIAAKVTGLFNKVNT